MPAVFTRTGVAVGSLRSHATADVSPWINVSEPDLPDSVVVGPAVRNLVYTDGACSGNPGPGGWAWLVPHDGFANGAEAHTTNQRMEITAAWRAVQANAGPLEVRSDSTYVVNCFRDRWWEGWLRRDWHNSQRKPVANRDLWEPFIDLVRQRGDVTFSWVKGHSGDEWNDRVDQLAVEALRNQHGRSGDRTPELTGPGDDVTAVTAVASVREGIAGHAIVVMGHQPPEIGGYDDNDWSTAIQRRLEAIITAKAEMFDDVVIVSGLRLGAEQLGAHAALAVGVPLVVVLPYPEPDARWPARKRKQFAEVCTAAKDVVLLQRNVPETTAKAAAAMNRRDAWLARHCREAILVWDGVDARLSRLHRSLVDHLGEDVWVLDPREVR